MIRKKRKGLLKQSIRAYRKVLRQKERDIFNEEMKVTGENLPSYKITSKGEKYLNTHNPDYLR
ncbi:hypothetical protein [Flammeovirga aprica]|uniref:hypothetical protein n=1 Tax=Flammeovirga aprica TaxID=29528 RepID=UPI0019823673|nr:hypothetical protein [Flammeovirga aprica]